MKIPLSELEAQFRTIGTNDAGEKVYKPVDSIDDAQGVWFLCPLCFEKNHGPVGTHLVGCWFNGRGVPADETPGPGRWNPSGTGLHDLTFVPPGAVSVLLTGGCGWHGFIVKGHAQDTPT